MHFKIGVILSLAALGDCFSQKSLEPGSIYWPQNSRNSPFEMTKVNSGQTADFTFNFRASTELPEGAVVEIHFPEEGFTLGMENCKQDTKVCAISKERISNDADESVTVTSVLLGEEGSYGPFKILTRALPESQIVDANYVFGNAFVASKTPNQGLLEVECNSTDLEVSSRNHNISFTFSLDSTDLWESDLIVIETPESLNWDSKVPSWSLVGVPVCEAVDSDEPNELFGSDGVSGALNCYQEKSKKIVVHGFSKNIFTDNKKVKINVGPFEAPGATYRGADFEWKVGIYRGSGNNLKLEYKGLGPYITLVPQKLSDVAWSTVQSLEKALPGMNLYNSIYFRNSKGIPEESKILITLSSVFSLSEVFVSSLVGTTVSVSGSEILITLTEPALSSTYFRVFMRSTLESQAKIASIEISTFASFQKIEEGSDFSFEFDEDLGFSVRGLQISGSSTSGTLEADGSLDFTVTGKNKLVDSEIIEVKCPFVAVSAEPLPLKSIAMEPNPTLEVVGEKQSDSTEAIASSGSASFVSGFLKVQIQTASSNAAEVQEVTFKVKPTQEKAIALPLVSSNEATFYECQFQSITQKEVAVGVFTVTAKEPSTGDSQKSFSSFVCKSNSEISSPLVLYIEGTELPVPLDPEFFIEITYGDSLKLGNSQTLSVYPGQASLSNNGKTVTITQISTSSPEIIIPNNNPEINSVESFFVYKKDQSFPEVKNVVWGNSLDFGKQGVSESGVEGNYSPESIELKPGSEASITTLSDALEFGLGYLVLSGGPGYDLSSVTFGDSQSVFTYTDSEVSVALFTGVSGTSKEIKGIKTPPTTSYGPQNDYLYLRNVESTGGSCLGSDIFKVTLTSGSVSQVGITPSSFDTLTTSKLTTQITISFRIEHQITEGRIIADLNYNFGLEGPATQITIEGLQNSDYELKLNPGNTITVEPAKVQAGSLLTLKLLKVVLPGSALTTQLIDSIETQAKNHNGDYKTIDFETENFPRIKVFVSPIVPVASSQISVFTSYPNLTGYKKADCYMEFTMPVTLPKGSEIEISPGGGSSFTSDNWDKDYCWSSIEYSNCIIESGRVILTLAVEYTPDTKIELYLDRAYNLPFTPGMYQMPIISAAYKGFFIVQDDPSNTEKYQVANDPSESVLGSLSLSISNPGEVSNYTLTLVPSVEISSSYKIWVVFPKSFNPYLGKFSVPYPNCAPNEVLLRCSSQLLESVECRVNHWTLMLSNLSTVTSGVPIQITIENLENPFKVDLDGLQVLILDENGNYLAHNQNETSIIPRLEEPAEALEIKSLEASSHETGSLANYNLEFVLPRDTDPNDFLEVRFPSPFDLTSIEQVACLLQFWDFQLNEWSQVSDFSCFVVSNRLLQQLTLYEVSSGYLMKLEINRIPLPEVGYSCSSDCSYDFWTKQFQILIFDGFEYKYSHRSFDQVSNSYLGIQATTTKFQTTNNPANPTPIKLVSGTQSQDLFITGSYLESQSLTFTPSGPNLTFSSYFHNFTLWQVTSSLSYRVSVPLNSTAGIYYANWQVDEKSHTGVDKYSSPLNTPFEVCEEKVQITVSEVPELYPGYFSVPISVKPALPPASELIVVISASQNISTTPSALVFGPGVDELFFQIKVTDNTTFEGNLSFYNIGKDSTTYLRIPDIPLEVLDIPSIEPSTLSFSVSEVSRNKATVRMEVDSPSIVYWWISCNGTLSGFTHDTNSSIEAFLAQRDIYYQDLRQEYLNYDTDSGQDVIAYFKDQFAEHCSKVYNGASVVYSSSSLSFDWLYSDTLYEIRGVSFGTLNTTEAKLTFKTSASPEVYSYQLTYFSKTNSTQIAETQKTLASYLGIPPSWLLYKLFESEPESSLFKLTLGFDVLYNRAKADNKPYDFVSKENPEQLTKQLEYYLSPEGSITTSYQAVASDGIPELSAELLSTTPSALRFSLKASKPGSVCSSCSQEEDSSVSASQVIVGLSSKNTRNPFSCTQFTDSLENVLEVNQLESDTEYFCYFAVCNSYPLWPQCREDISYMRVSTKSYELDQTEHSVSLVTSLAFLSFGLII